jgi:hypothetical protein
MGSLLFFDIVHIEFFLRFQVAHLDLIIGQRSLEYLKPFFVKPVKDWNTCCIYHVQFNELKLVLNPMRTKSTTIHDIERCGCHYDNMCSKNGQPY